MAEWTEKEQSRIHAVLLLDFYGNLLPERARVTLERYLEDDLSLSELALQDHVSRQAVHDRVRQGLEQLNRYEDKLGLVTRYRQEQAVIRAAIEDLDRGNAGSARTRLLELAQAMMEG